MMTFLLFTTNLQIFRTIYPLHFNYISKVFPSTLQGPVRKFLFVLCSEISCRDILHWNYRGLVTFPPELLAGGQHVLELYLKVRQDHGPNIYKDTKP